MSFGSPGCFSMVSLSLSFRFPDFCKAACMVGCSALYFC
jgi:hypothetical protein